MIEATFEAVVPTPAYAEFEAIVPRERSMPIINQERYFDTNGKYEIKSEEGTAMTKVDVEVDIRPAEFNDVNFFDYDGTILYSYSWEEFLEYNQLPPLPTHNRLVCQEWNYTLDEIIEQGGRCDVGAIYDTEDGNTKIVVDATKNNTVSLIIQNPSEEVTIDWGDGSIENTTEKYVNVEKTHIYNEIKEYIINIYSIGTYYIDLFHSVNIPYIYGGKNLSRLTFRSSLIKAITIPNNCTFKGGTKNYIIKHVNFPRTATYIDSNVFNSSYSLASVSIPNSCESIYSFFENAFLENLHIPSNITTLTFVSSVSSKYSIRNISISKKNNNIKYVDNCFVKDNEVIAGFNGYSVPKEITKIGNYAFINAINNNVDIPDSVTSIGTNAFYGIPYCRTVYMGKNVTSIGSYAYGYATVIEYYDFSNYEHIPTLVNSSAFNGISAKCIIIVPDDLYDDWIVATNWSNLKDKISKVSDSVYIDFKDATVGKLCIDKWGNTVALSKFIAARIIDLEGVFRGKNNISYFNELKYFTGLTSIGAYCLQSTSLIEITIPKNVKTLAYYCLGSNNKLIKIVSESTQISTIQGGALYNNPNLETLILPVITPPTLSNSDEFIHSTKLNIYVPDESVTAYKTATNWSLYADKIKPMSEYVES